MSSNVKVDVVFSSINHQLKHVTFNAIEEMHENHSVIAENLISTKHIDNNGFTLEAKKTLALEPRGIFEGEIVFDIKCQFDQTTRKNFNGDIEAITRFIEKRKFEIFNRTEVGGLMSILLGQLTLIFNQRPIISAPFIEIKPD
jgi:hypothetical protein